MLRGLCRRRGRKAVRVSDDGGRQGKVSTRLNLTDKRMNSEAVVAYPGPKQVQVTVSVVFLSFFLGLVLFYIGICYLTGILLVYYCFHISVFMGLFVCVFVCIPVCFLKREKV